MVLLKALGTVASFESEKLRDFLGRHRPSGVKLFEEVSRFVEIDHQNKVVFIEGVPFDPLLDVEPFASVFAYLEETTQGGITLELPNLGVRVYAPPGIALRTQKDLYSLLDSGNCRLYLCEGLLYVVPQDDRYRSISPRLQEVLASGLMLEIRPVVPKSGTLETVGPLDFDALRFIGTQAGSLDLSLVRPSCDERWLRGKGPRLSPLIDFPAAMDWMTRHEAWIDWSDLERLEGVVEALWKRIVYGELTEGMIEAARFHVQGLLGEIYHRPRIIEDYRAHQNGHPQRILLIEGHIRTSDGLRASDALIGLLDPRQRMFKVESAFEITTDPGNEDPTWEQHRNTIERRFPEKDMLILAESGAWGRVMVHTEEAQRMVIVSPPSVQEDLRREAGEIIQEILAYLSFKKQAAAGIPIEERRRYEGVRGVKAAGHLLSLILDELWKGLDQKQKITGRYDLAWFAAQIRARIPAFPAVGRHFLQDYLAILTNMSADLNPTGQRLPLNALISQLAVSPSTAQRYVRTMIEPRLKDRGLALLPDPAADHIQKIDAGNRLSQLVAPIWEKDTLEEIDRFLETMISETQDEAVRKRLVAYQFMLRNLLPGWNTSGRRLALHELAKRTGLSIVSVTARHREIEAHLLEMGIPVLPDPLEGRGEKTLAGKELVKRVAGIWVEGSAPEVLRALDRIIEEEKDPGTVKYLKAYRWALVNVSADLNGEGRMEAIAPLAEDLEIPSGTIRKYETEIEGRLREKGWKTRPHRKDRKLEPKGRIGRRLPRLVASVWEQPTAEAMARHLEGLIEREQDRLAKILLIAYLAALKNVSRDLNPTGQRAPAADIAGDCSGGTILNYQREVESSLRAKGLRVIPTPEALTRQLQLAGRRVERVLEPLWRTTSAREMERTLEDLIRASGEEGIQRLLEVHLAALRNLSADLNGSGRNSSYALSRSLGLSTAAMDRYQGRMEDLLLSKGLPVLPDPEAVHRKKVAAAQSFAEAVGSIWEGKTAGDIDGSLATIPTEEWDEETATLLKAYRAALRNVCHDLNPTQVRVPADEVASRTNVSPQTIVRYQRAIEEKLEEKGITAIPDPEKTASGDRTVSHGLARFMDSVWKYGTALAIEGALRTFAEDESYSAVKALLSGYRIVFQDVSADLNGSGKRATPHALARRAGIAEVTVRRYASDIEQRLGEKGLSVVPPRPDRGVGEKTVAGIKVKQMLQAVWRRPTAADMDRALGELIEGEKEAEVKALLEVYRIVLHNVSRDLNPTGQRSTVSGLSVKHLAHPTVSNYQKEVETCLMAKGLGVFPDPNPALRENKSAGFLVGRFTKPLWKLDSLAKIVANLEKEIQDEERTRVKVFLQTYLAVLKSVSSDLNPSGRRLLRNEIAATMGVDYQVVLGYEKNIEAELEKKGWPVNPFVGATKGPRKQQHA